MPTRNRQLKMPNRHPSQGDLGVIPVTMATKKPNPTHSSTQSSTRDQQLKAIEQVKSQHQRSTAKSPVEE
jgi:hypothetical protein